MMKTINKNHIAILLFFCCLGLAFFNVYKIMDNIKQQELVDIEQAKLDNTLFVNQKQVDMPIHLENDWYLVNVIFALFVGGLIYGKIEWD